MPSMVTGVGFGPKLPVGAPQKFAAWGKGKSPPLFLPLEAYVSPSPGAQRTPRGSCGSNFHPGRWMEDFSPDRPPAQAWSALQ